MAGGALHITAELGDGERRVTQRCWAVGDRCAGFERHKQIKGQGQEVSLAGEGDRGGGGVGDRNG